MCYPESGAAVDEFDNITVLLIVNYFSALRCRLCLWPHVMISKLERNYFTVVETLKSREAQILSDKRPKSIFLRF